MLLPVGTEQQRHGIAGAVHHSATPYQDADLKLRPPLDQRTQKFPKRPAIVIVGAQFDAAVEIPRDDENRSLSLPQRLLETEKIFRRVDENSRTMGPDDATAVAAGYQDCGIGRPNGFSAEWGIAICK
jgi:hypothetical protein